MVTIAEIVRPAVLAETHADGQPTNINSANFNNAAVNIARIAAHTGSPKK